MLCVRDGCAAGPEARLEFESGGRIVTSKSLEIIEMVTQKKAVAWGFAVTTTKNQKG